MNHMSTKLMARTGQKARVCTHESLSEKIQRFASPAAAPCLIDLTSQYHKAGISPSLLAYAAEQTVQHLALSHAENLTYLDTLRMRRYFAAIIKRKAPYDCQSQDYFNRQFLRGYLERSRRAGWSDELIYTTLINEYQSYLTPAMQEEFLRPLALPCAA